MLACKKVPSILKPPPFDLILVQINTLGIEQKFWYSINLSGANIYQRKTKF